MEPITPTDMLTAIEAEEPGVASAIAALWGEPELREYLTDLLLGDEQRFSEPVFRALAGIQELDMAMHTIQSQRLEHMYG